MIYCMRPNTHGNLTSNNMTTPFPPNRFLVPLPTNGRNPDLPDTDDMAELITALLVIRAQAAGALHYIRARPDALRRCVHNSDDAGKWIRSWHAVIQQHVLAGGPAQHMWLSAVAAIAHLCRDDFEPADVLEVMHDCLDDAPDAQEMWNLAFDHVRVRCNAKFDYAPLFGLVTALTKAGNLTHTEKLQQPSYHAAFHVLHNVNGTTADNNSALRSGWALIEHCSSTEAVDILKGLDQSPWGVFKTLSEQATSSVAAPSVLPSDFL